MCACQGGNGKRAAGSTGHRMCACMRRRKQSVAGWEGIKDWGVVDGWRRPTRQRETRQGLMGGGRPFWLLKGGCVGGHPLFPLLLARRPKAAVVCVWGSARKNGQATASGARGVVASRSYDLHTEIGTCALYKEDGMNTYEIDRATTRRGASVAPRHCCCSPAARAASVGAGDGADGEGAAGGCCGCCCC